MTIGRQRLLSTLAAEREFLKAGGYEDPGRLPWRPRFIFEDSPTCLNYRNAARRKPCADCLLFELVPNDRRNQKFPCRFIPLNEQGETIDSFYRSGSQEELIAALEKWLNATISKLRAELPQDDSDSSRPKALQASQSGRA